MSPADTTPENQPGDGPERKPRKRAAKKVPAVSVPNAEAQPAADPILTLTEVLEDTYVRVMRQEPQLRGFGRAIEDVGLPVPRDWARFQDHDTVTFAPISAKSFRRFINVLEQIAERLPEPICPSPSAHDEPLFELVTTQSASEMNTTSNSATNDGEE
ncbi:MAG: hypothetical protein F2934_12625 [Actinobacteria bacterium]|uniref:Unannotated protein n=1 Tax=freshwater metagenome TaxID=449393 RepID=A0A6J7US24_9ZZZZ|nr:hypothetical protein [Actinomycetota bacterium]MSZ05118.1 hypothetical protein [Actinomycetota bacterium]MTB07961.1 hypothetical protein [Actinomycetota bacterium]